MPAILPAEVAVPVIGPVEGEGGRLKAHGRVGPGGGVADGEVVDVRLRHQRHQREARVVADAPRLQAFHHAVGRAQPVGAAAGEHDGVDGLGGHQRVEQLAFPGSGPAAAHVQTGAHAVRADKDRAARGSFGVFNLADAYVLDVVDGDFICHKLYLRRRMACNHNR